MEIEFPIPGEENQFTAMVENAADVIREAISALEGWGARPELEEKLKTVWFELHQVADPHCSCSDCLAAMEEPDGAPLGTRYTLPADEPAQEAAARFDARTTEDLLEGITFFSTPSHGGFKLSSERLLELPEALRKTDLRYCGASWFEEDCEASLVVVGFPDHFTDDERARALGSLKCFYPTKHAAYLQSEHARAHAACGQPIDAAMVAPCEKPAGHAGPCRAYSQERS